ncbi:hypothetical protein ACLOJK_041089 [Asimina triloba]
MDTVHGVEYAFGAHDYPTSGVFEVEPRHCPGFKFRKSIFMGTTRLDPLQIREFMEHHAAFYKGNAYHLVFKNCNHFCKDVCYRLTGNSIPEWVNRLARIGSVCSCILPERFSAVQRDPAGYESCDSEKKKLRSAFGCMPSISTGQRHLSISSPFLSSPSKDDCSVRERCVKEAVMSTISDSERAGVMAMAMAMALAMMGGQLLLHGKWGAGATVFFTL